MRASSLHAPTLRDPPRDAEVVSHQLLVRGGFIRKSAAGIYSFLPLGMRVLRKVAQIIRDEMDAAGAQEVQLPIVIPGELWEESGRWAQYGPELLRLQDRKGGNFCVGPTHEEAVVDLVRRDITSYKQVPLCLYQIQLKFRDEMRPRAGLMRGREFLMKDAYSFDVDVEGAKAAYEVMRGAYTRIFERCGFDFRMVAADSGNIGGSLSHEFQVVAQSGEDAIATCDASGYAANVELVPLAAPARAEVDPKAPAPEVVDTPGAKKIDSVCKALGIGPAALIKAVAFVVDGQTPAVVFVRADRDANEVKVKRHFNARTLELADAAWFAKATGLKPGYIGPLGVHEAADKAERLLVAVDAEVFAMPTAACGANAVGQHRTGVVPSRDLAELPAADLRFVVDGDPSPDGEGPLRLFRGIEVGHIFYLGTKYSEAMNATFLDEHGASHPFEMGCYGIGVSRIMSAAIEQHHDERGICWPVALAPFEVAVLALGKSDEEQAIAAELYETLRGAEGLDVLLDDRPTRPGVKFKDADLIGFPVQVVVGRRASEGFVEVKVRATGARVDVAIEGLATQLGRAIRAARDGSALHLELGA